MFEKLKEQVVENEQEEDTRDLKASDLGVLMQEYAGVENAISAGQDRREKLRKAIMARIMRSGTREGSGWRVALSNFVGVVLQKKGRTFFNVDATVEILERRGLIKECCTVVPDKTLVSNAIAQGKISKEEAKVIFEEGEKTYSLSVKPVEE